MPLFFYAKGKSMAETIIKYRVTAEKSLAYRKKPTKESSIVGYLNHGDKVSIVKGWSKKSDGIVWYKLKSNKKYFYVSSRYLVRVTPNYLSRVGSYADEIYAEIVALGCRHGFGAVNHEQMQAKKIVTCATSASIVLQLAGILPKDKLINHTSAVGDSKVLTKKTTVADCFTGRSKLINGTCSVERMMKKYSALPSKFKVKGAVYVYDSNVAINAGDGKIYSCNNSASQLKDGKYAKVKLSSGYCFTSPILYVILPND